MFAALWQPPARMSRVQAYGLMAKLLGIPHEDAHIACLSYDESTRRAAGASRGGVLTERAERHRTDPDTAEPAAAIDADWTDDPNPVAHESAV